MWEESRNRPKFLACVRSAHAYKWRIEKEELSSQFLPVELLTMLSVYLFIQLCIRYSLIFYCTACPLCQEMG